MRWLVSLIAVLLVAALALWRFAGSRDRAELPAQLASSPEATHPQESARVESAAEPDRERTTAAEAVTTEAAPQGFMPRVRGTVVDTQHHPIAGADIDPWIYYFAGDVSALADSRDYATFGEGLHPKTKTDAQGRFEFTCSLTKGADSGAFTIRMWISAPDHVRADVSTQLARGEAGDTGEVVLPLASTLSGIVVDSRGTALEGVRVRALGKRRAAVGSTGRSASIDSDPVKSAADGRFTLARVPPGQVDVSARAEDTRESRHLVLDIAEGESQDDLRLVLPFYEDANSISGIVLSPQGEPVPRARMSLAVENASGQGSSSRGFTSDSQGRFRQELLGHRARLSAEDKDGRLSAVLDNLEPGMHDLRLQLKDAATLGVRAIDEHGPVLNYGWSIRQETSKNSFLIGAPEPSAPRSEGRAAIRVPVNPFYVELRSEGYAALELGPFERDALPEEALFRLEPALGIRGTVVSGGKPLAGATLVLWKAVDPGLEGQVDNLPARMFPIRPTLQVASSAEGAFFLPVDRAGRYHLRATSTGLAPGVTELLDYVPAAGIADLVIALPVGGSIEGRAFETDGSPRANRWVVATNGWPIAASAKADEQGAFRFEHLAPGPYCLLAAEGPTKSEPLGWGGGAPGSAAAMRYDCVVRDGETTHYDLRAPDPADLLLALPRDLGALGEWRVDADVTFRGRTLHGSPSWNEKRDELRLKFEAGGPCTLFLGHSGDPAFSEQYTISGSFDLPPGSSSQVLKFQSGRLRVRLGPGTEPKSAIGVQATLGPGWEFFASRRADDAGLVEFVYVPAGKCKVYRSASSDVREVEVKAGETLEVEGL